MKRILIVSGLFCILNNLFAATPVTYDFAVVDGDTLRMDVYMPDGEVKAPRPAVLFAFGSGFINGSRSNPDYACFFDFLADNGIVAVSTDYRTSLSKSDPESLGSVAGFAEALGGAITDAVTDFYTATGYLLANAGSLGIDPSMIIASGSSAGAITAIQAEYGLVNGAVPGGVFPDGFNYAGLMSFAGAAVCSGDSLAWKAAPCPMMLFHGDADRNVPYGTVSAGGVSLCGSKTIAESLAGVKALCEFYTMAGADHSVAVSPMHDKLYTILGFIRHIQNGSLKTSLDAVEFVPGAPTDYETDFSISDFIRANMP